MMSLCRSALSRSLFPIAKGKGFFMKVSFSSNHGTHEPANENLTQENDCGSNKKKLRRAVTPIGKLDEYEEGKHPYQEKEPLPPWPNNTNPITGEIGGPRGPEPTRYGDWERKGRVSDF